jgi:anion-transporting  ArsA/GET3 family ATPase
LPAKQVLEELGERRLLIVSGKGGVGRTTVAALLGMALAEQGRRVLVGTTGHDDRLAWMCGADVLPDVPLRVGKGPWIQRLVPSTCVREYGAMVLGSARLARTVFDNAIVRRLLRAIPGLDDFAILGKVWHEACRAHSYDVVVFDGPATGHLRLELGVPHTIIDTAPEGPLAREAAALQASLEDPRQTGVVLVGLPEKWPLTELGELSKSLREEVGLRVAALVVNKTWASDLPELDPSRVADARVRSLFELVDEMGDRGRGQARIVEHWLDSPAGESGAEALLEIPFCPRGLDRPEELQELLRALRGDETFVPPLRAGTA